MPCGIAIEFNFFGEVCLCVYDVQVTGTCHQDLLTKSKCLSLTALNRTYLIIARLYEISLAKGKALPR